MTDLPRYPMGYWVNENDDPEKTVANDRRELERLADFVPGRFQHREARKCDKMIYDRCWAFGQERDKAVEGWDMSWLEEVVGIKLDLLPAQIIGSCVATSHITLIATRALTECLLLGQSEELLGRKLTNRDSICPYGPYSYRAGRKFAGINGNSDGSTCSGQIRGTMTYGYLPCDTASLESDFFPEPKSTGTYRRWGAGDSLLEQFASEGKKLDLVEAPECRDVETAIQLLKEFKPLQICSGWGFRAASKRLPNGDTLYSRSGSWAHSMQVIAAVKMTDGQWYFKIRNQWGMAHSGKPYFWVASEEMQRWLRAASTYAIGELQQRKSNPELVWI